MTVKAWLKGHDFDLQDLASLLPSGETRVMKEGDRYYIASTEMDHRPAGVEPYQIAPRVLQRVNGLARAQNPKFQPVKLDGHYDDGEAHHVVVVADAATIRGRAHVAAAGVVTTADGEVVPPPPPDGPLRERAAASSPSVEEALMILGKPDALNWGTWLNKVYEIVRDDVKPRSISDLGWASEGEIKAFTGSANRPDVSGAHARHARLPGGPPRRQMSQDEAEAFIGRLVTSWIDSKRTPQPP
jgi:hypothetical protein